MNIRKIIPFLLVGALALAALGAYAVRTVNAQAETPTPGDTAPDGQDFPGRGPRPRGPEGRGGGYMDEDLAAALGISVDELQAAHETAQAEALEQAVSQGLITQEQADAIAARGAGRLPFGGRFLKDSAIDVNALLADALNVTVEELQSARAEAFNTAIDRAVTEGSLTQEQADLLKGQRALGNDTSFQANMRSAFEAAVAQAVQDGVITQAQADQILAQSAGSGFRGWGGGRHGFGGRDGHRAPAGDQPAPPENPTVTPSDGA